MPLDGRDRARLLDMVQHAKDAMALEDGYTLDEVVADLAVRHAVVRCMEIHWRGWPASLTFHQGVFYGNPLASDVDHAKQVDP